ncbi:MAG: AAA family ATPase [Acidimicrobiia bacterium]
MSVRVQRDGAVAADYALALPAVAKMGELPLDPGVTFLVGANGSGKSTILEGIAVAAGLNAEGGSRNFRFGTKATHSTLHEHLVLTRTGKPRTDFFLRAESFYNVATEIDTLGLYDSYGGSSLHARSHGESFLAVVLHRFGPDGLYLLDEPEAALSPQGQLTLLRAMYELVEAGSQFIIATHSPILVAFPGAAIFECSQDGVECVSFDDVPQTRLYRSFLDDPGRFLHYLFAPDEEEP